MKGLKGSVNQRGTSWQALLSYKKEDGTWGKRSQACKTKTEALQVLKAWNLEESSGITQENPTLREARDLWLREKKLSGADNSIATYEFTSDLILEHLDKGVKDITRDDIVNFFFELKDMGLEISYYKSVLSMIFNYLIQKKIVVSNPTLGIKATRTKEKRTPIILTDEQRMIIIEKLQGTSFYYPVTIALLTGLRKGELCGLKWEYIDLIKNEIQVKEQHTLKGQTNKLKSDLSYRTIEMDSSTKQLFTELKDSIFTEREYVFKDHPHIYDQIYYECNKFGIAPHDLRHNHATDLLDIMNHADAANRMGHTVEEYVKTYVHSSADSRKKAIPKLDSRYNILFGNNSVTNNVINFAKR